MPTLVGARRRGYTPEGFRLFAERIGVSKADSWIEYSVLEDCMREDLNARAQRRIAVLDPVKLIIDNYPEGRRKSVTRRTIRRSRSSANARSLYARAVDRARRFHGERRRKATSGCSRQQRAPALRLRGQVHALREGRERQRARCTANICPKRNQARPARSASKSKATSTGFRRGIHTRVKSVSMIGCSAWLARAARAISSKTSTPTRSV